MSTQQEKTVRLGAIVGLAIVLWIVIMLILTVLGGGMIDPLWILAAIPVSALLAWGFVALSTRADNRRYPSN